MACSSRVFLSLLLLTSACGDDDPGLGSGAPDPEDSSGTDASSDSSDTLDPDSSGTTGEDAWVPICDGSEGLRLAARLSSSHPGGSDPAVMSEIGFAYLYVLGTCDYFVLPVAADGPGGRWPDARTGVLDPAAEEELSRDIDYGRLAELAGAWSDPDELDASTLVVSDGVHTVSCFGGCSDGPEGADAVWGVLSWADSLWLQGEAYEGPLRISVIGWADSTLDELPAPWPLPGVDPWSIASDGNVDPPPQAGDSLLVDDPEQVEALRELRRRYREGDLPEGVPNSLMAYGHLTFEASGDLFQLWMRDALPIEDDMGLVPLPQP